MDRPGEILRGAAMAVLNAVRRRPALHRPVHKLAALAVRTPLGARMIRAVLRPRYPTSLDYARWLEANGEPSAEDRAAIAGHIARMVDPPVISVVMPVYETEGRVLDDAIASVRNQLYPHWELCIADDASPSPRVWAQLQAAAVADPRIRIVRREANGHISAATNSALALATGQFVALMDHDDVLAETALYEMAAEIERHPDAQLLFSDEDRLDAEGRRCEPHFKPGWNPELMLSQHVVGHLAVYRRSLVERLDGVREGFEGAQDYDLALRAAEGLTEAEVRHVPAVLYHWRRGDGSFSAAAVAACADAARRAVEEHLVRTGAKPLAVERRDGERAWVQVHRAPPHPLPLVSAIVPTRDRAELLAGCARGLLQATDYPALELLIVDNGSVEPTTRALFAELSQDRRVRIIEAPGPFNYSALNNQAAAQARGEILLLLNNDIEVIGPGWLQALVAEAARPEVGAAGARLLYADGRVQHAGVVLGVGVHPAVAGHLCVGAERTDPGYYGHLVLPRNVSAVTGACLATRREVFESVGGLDAEHLAVAFNDVDYCLKLRERSLQVVWTPVAELFHLESASRGSDMAPAARVRYEAEAAWMRQRWGETLANDPYFNPAFDLRAGDYGLAPVPRRTPPWR